MKIFQTASIISLTMVLFELFGQTPNNIFLTSDLLFIKLHSYNFFLNNRVFKWVNIVTFIKNELNIC